MAYIEQCRIYVSYAMGDVYLRARPTIFVCQIPGLRWVIAWIVSTRYKTVDSFLSHGKYVIYK